jgi:hypothetical protein
VLSLQLDTTAPSILMYSGQNGAGLGHAPSSSPNAQGDATVTWDPSYTDEYGNQLAVLLRSADATVWSSVVRTATIVSVGTRAVRVISANPVSGLLFNDKVSLVVY